MRSQSRGPAALLLEGRGSIKCHKQLLICSGGLHMGLTIPRFRRRLSVSGTAGRHQGRRRPRSTECCWVSTGSILEQGKPQHCRRFPRGMLGSPPAAPQGAFAPSCGTHPALSIASFGTSPPPRLSSAARLRNTYELSCSRALKYREDEGQAVPRARRRLAGLGSARCQQAALSCQVSIRSASCFPYSDTDN